MDAVRGKFKGTVNPKVPLLFLRLMDAVRGKFKGSINGQLAIASVCCVYKP